VSEPELVEYFPADASAWISETPLRTEYARLMRGFLVPFRGRRLTHRPSLLICARSLLAYGVSESPPSDRSITGFSTLSFDFIAAGAPVDLVAVCHRVCIDELRHTELAVKMVDIHGGRRPPLPRDIATLPADESLTAVAQACRSAIGKNLFGTLEHPAAVDVTNDDPRLGAHGVCSMREEQDLYRAFVPDVFIPGLLACGVPVDRAVAMAALPALPASPPSSVVPR
jgi:hypothetical protein